MWIGKVGAVSAKLPRCVVHNGSERYRCSETIPSQRGGSVIFTLHHHGGQQCASSVGLAGRIPSLLGSTYVSWRNHNAAVQISPFQNKERREKFRFAT